MIKTRLRGAVIACWLACTPLGGGAAAAQERPAAAAKPAGEKPMDFGQTMVSPDAAKLLQEMQGGYDKMRSLHVKGTITWSSEQAGKVISKSMTDFEAWFQSPCRFRIVVGTMYTDEKTRVDQTALILLADGKNAYTYQPQPAANTYTVEPFPDARVAPPNPLKPGFRLQPRILMRTKAIGDLVYPACFERGAELLVKGGGQAIAEAQPAERIGDAMCPGVTIRSSSPLWAHTFYLDPKTKLPRRIIRVLPSPSDPTSSSVVAHDCQTFEVDGEIAKDKFVWKPLPGARMLTQDLP